jgi:hypothetical protein
VRTSMSDAVSVGLATISSARNRCSHAGVACQS